MCHVGCGTYRGRGGNVDSIYTYLDGIENKSGVILGSSVGGNILF